MQPKSNKGLNNSNNQKKNKRPNSSYPLQSKNKCIVEKNRNINTKINSIIVDTPDKYQIHLKINPLNSNNNFRATRPSSSAIDRVFNKYWDDKTPNAINFQTISKFDYQSPKGENLITNQLLVDLNRKQKTIYNRSLYKYNKIDWDSKKNSNFLSTVGGLEIKSNNCLLNNPIINHENFSINSTAIGSRPQSNTAYNSANFNLKSVTYNKKERPLTYFPTRNKNNINQESENILNIEGPSNFPGIVNKRPLTALIYKTENALRPFSSNTNIISYYFFNYSNKIKIIILIFKIIDINI